MIDYKNLPKRPKPKPKSLMPGFIITIIYVAIISVLLSKILWGTCHA